ncbi:MAG: NUDIX domain-containing protein [Blastopirellula sp. JB062]
MSIAQVEHILVVPTAEFRNLGHFQGFSPDATRYLDHLLQPQMISFRPRPAMEEDPSFKQLIPYVIFEHVDADGVISVFQYVRGKGQGEARLHSKRSVGVGGHISSEDAAEHLSGNPYEEGMRRELAEEVEIGSDYEIECVGLINDDQNPVGQVHLGVVHRCRVAQPSVTPRESEIIEAGFVPVTQLLSELDRCETWSSICLEALYG